MANNTTICDFGLHQGEPYTQLPVSFLKWMIDVNHQKSQYAHDELARRKRVVEQQREALLAEKYE
ncbi:hypothetical protein P20311_2017 [Pseudoalteromonas sp. BSi20311]|uniref:hypothetical protein n=1 Tax=unclassified Pseudoalteromonas TaxID=194690 RepID=UPI0002319206|nr:hypothetical protein [Pseudoalteromonas sp. BSi20311]MAJ40793.1 hypothetical protein [Pseudoalteromonadaceae bacterium]GAA64223.1 hypothetical protein P20311_2017 [Pseudoalteromonas sp. BSi20311]|tara:strand:+ start:672 stop:866 length:195 start_codon:yes stop_codon:yes gene_type:complete